MSPLDELSCLLLFISHVRITSLGHDGFIFRIFQLFIDDSSPLVKIRMSADISVVPQPVVVSFTLVVGVHPLVVVHDPGRGIVRTINPCPIHVFDHLNGKFSLPPSERFSQDKQIMDPFLQPQ